MARKREFNLVKKEYKTYGCGCNGMCWHKCSGVYGLGFLGALVYFLQTSTGFWASVLAILKAIVWPAFAVYHLLGL